MKTKGIRFLSLLLSVVMLTGLFTTTTLAANYSTNYKQYSTPSSSDYAYWDGSRVVHASGTTISEMKWMQASLNWCISNLGLNANYLEVDGSMGPASRATVIAFQKAAGLTADGSFGPESIEKMKHVVDNEDSLTWISASNSITVKPGTTTTLKVRFGGVPISSIGGSYSGSGLSIGFTNITWGTECSATIQITASSSFKQSGSVTFKLVNDTKGTLNSKTIAIVPQSTSSNTGTYSLCWPVSTTASGYKTITSSLGARNAPVAGASVNHKGIDIGVANAKVLATADGVVKFVGSNSARGKYVVVYHQSLGLTSVYQHLSSYSVKEGQSVSKGQEIARSGNTGNSSGPHLHFELVLTSSAPSSVDCAWVGGAKLLDGHYNNSLIRYEYRK